MGNDNARIAHMKTRRHPAIALFLWMLASLLAMPAAASPVALSAGADRIDLTPRLGWLHDRDARLDAAQALRLAGRPGGFAPLDGDPTFGFNRGAFWFHVTLENTGPQPLQRLLVLEYALIDEIDLYLQYPDGRLLHQRSGDLLPFASRAIRYRHPNFLVDLPPGERVELLLRTASKSSMQVPLRLYSRTAFTELARDAQLGLGIYNGILLALLFYNLILWLSVRDASYLWYLLHIAAIGLSLLCLNGLAFEYLWPDLPRLANTAIPLSICLAQLAMHQFARHFLGLSRRWPVGNRLSLAFIGFHALLAALSLAIDYRMAVQLATAAVFPGVLLILVQTVHALHSGYRPARLYLLAWGMLLAGITTYAMVSFGALPKTFATEYGFQLGSALEMILLSVALAYRYAALRNDNERIVREANEQLERNVARRTDELRTALEQLAEANGRLRELSQRDSLTGALNRHSFREALEHLLSDARMGGAPLSVLMVDLDHFKAINDDHGHLAGDDCLRQVAARLQEAIHPHHGLLGRFGGEEFVIALPGLGHDAARVVAEKLRAAIAATPFGVAGHGIPLTISVGAHTPDTAAAPSPDDAMRCADEALYAAKRGGRNCVRQTPAPETDAC